MRELRFFLAGSWEGRPEVPVVSPWDGRTVSLVARAGEEALAAASEAAHGARGAMAALSSERRAAILERTRELLLGERESFAAIVCEEAGKPVSLARAEVERAADTLRAAAHVARSPEVLARDLSGFASGAGRLALVKRVPVGPVLAITPFNFPLNLVMHKVAPAIAAGCPVVVKPASQTPSAALSLARLLCEAGLPPGGLSVLPCRGSEALSLVDDRRFRLVTFTGSSEVGWELKRRAWDRRVTLELGGNAAVIVEDDATDLPNIASRIANAAFAYAGQSCISVQRVYASRKVHPALREALIQATRSFPFGDPSLEETLCGPLIDEANAERVSELVQGAVEAGGTLLVGGEKDGGLVRPALLENVPENHPLVADEAFGPVAVLSSYDDFEKALELVNASRYGLQAGLYTNDLGKIRRAWDVLEVGGLMQGDVPTWRCDPMPYGGVKDSGVGREGPEFTIREMTEERLLVLR